MTQKYKGYVIETYLVEDRITSSKKEVGPWIPRAKVSWQEQGKWKTELMTQDHSYRFKPHAERAAIEIAKRWIDEREPG